MFKKLEKRVVASIFVATAVFVLAISLVTAAVIGRSYVGTFEDNVSEAVRIAVEYSAIKLATIESDAVKIAGDEGIRAGLSGAAYVNTINPKLNYFRSQYQEEISGLTLYAANGYTYKTDSLPVASVMPFATLSAIPAVAAFIASGEAALVVPLSADGAVPTIRSFAIIVRITGDDGALGYLFVDVSPDYMFHTYFAFAGHPGFSLIASYVAADGALRHPSENRIDVEHLALAGNAGFSADGRAYVVGRTLYAAGTELVLAVNATSLFEDVLTIVATLFVIDAAILAGSFLLAKRHAAFLVGRLAALRETLSRATARIA